jgi:hypothetical protein
VRDQPYSAIKHRFYSIPHFITASYLSVQLLPALHVGRAGISVFPKEHQNLITEARYISATISLKFRARVTKFQGDVPEALKRGISLVRLVICTDHVKLTAAERISSHEPLPHDNGILSISVTIPIESSAYACTAPLAMHESQISNRERAQSRNGKQDCRIDSHAYGCAVQSLIIWGRGYGFGGLGWSFVGGEEIRIV